MSKDFVWTADKYRELEALWPLNQSMSVLGAHFGVTRSAVSGAIKRARKAGYNLPWRQPNGNNPDAPKSVYKPAPIRKERVVSMPKSPTPLPKPRDDLSDGIRTEDLQSYHCRFPINDGVPEWLHCGRERADHGWYCQSCRAKSISSSPVRRMA